MARLELPKKKKELSDALDKEMIPAEQEAMVHLTHHKIIDAYLNGMRKFRVTDRFRGQMEVAFENSKGDIEMRYEEINSIYLTEMGRYMKINIDPVATKKGESIGALRKAAIGHATLGALATRLPLNMIRKQALIPFLKFGTVGINHVETGNKRAPDRIEIVPPRQLRGFPAWVDGTENLMGIARKRWVPLPWLERRLKDVYDKKLPTGNVQEDLMAQDVPWGVTPPDKNFTNQYGQTSAISTFRTNRMDLIGTNITHQSGDDDAGLKKKDGLLYVPLEEIYVYADDQQFVARFIIKVGRHIAVDENFEEQGLDVLSPLHVARHTDTGKFFGRSFIAPLMPMNDQIEKMMKSLFKNVIELDMFGTLFITGGMGIDLKRWRTGPRPKVQKYEPDPLDPNIQPINLVPKNAGTLPAQIADYAQKQMQVLSGQGSIFQGETSGRVDSAAGLGFLFNTGNIKLGLPVNGFADAFAGVYSRMLQVAKERLGPGETIELAVIDEAIAGVVIDPSTGLLQLAENPIPDPWDINIDIRDRTPRDRDVRKAELKELLGLQLVDFTRFWITALEENLDMPGAPKELWETWRKVIWQIIMLFRDGTTPGTISTGEHTQNADIQLLAVQQFMNKIEYSLSSAEVKAAFEGWKIDLEILAGVRFPAGLPSPEEAAVQQAAGGQQRPGIEQLNIPEGMAPGAQF